MFLLIKRLYRLPKFGADKYAPRHQAIVTWTVSGPFMDEVAANKAAVAAMKTYTCLLVRIVTREQLLAIAKASNYDQSDNDLSRAVSAVVKMLSH